MQTPYFKKLHGEIMRLGGLYNAHLHLCRSGTLDETEALLAAEGANQYSHLSIPKKHGLIPLIHGSPAYDRENLRQRVGMYLQLMADVGTTRADTLVDVTTDRVGLLAFEELLRFKEERRRSLDLQIGTDRAAEPTHPRAGALAPGRARGRNGRFRRIPARA